MMRKPIFKCVFVVMLVLFASSALAQVKVIPKVPTMPTKIQKIPKLVMPDLVIESFSINSSHGVSVGSNMEYPVSAVIKISATPQLKALYTLFFSIIVLKQDSGSVIGPKLML